MNNQHAREKAEAQMLTAMLLLRGGFCWRFAVQAREDRIECLADDLHRQLCGIARGSSRLQ